jgi:hypothetical protein
MAIEIVDFPIKNGEFPVRYVSLPEGTNNDGSPWEFSMGMYHGYCWVFPLLGELLGFWAIY